jgi:uncharacterized membrane protein YphA (DoxX/SURF4 family)
MNSPYANLGTAPSPSVAALINSVVTMFSRIPDSLIALIGRFSIAAVFWKSGQTKIEGLAIDIVAGDFQFGWPRLSDSAVELFRSEYRLPLLPPELAAPMPFLWIGGQLAWFGEFGVEAVNSGFREAAAQSVRREFFV